MQHAAAALLSNGQYRVIKKLNKGATAVVYAASDTTTGRPVALKVVQCDSNKAPVSVVRREVNLSSSVAHENMVQLLDVFAEGTELIIVWELISGGDLLELLNECRGCMTEAAAAFYYVQLLRAVLHMHMMGYCHRDIKPENCMIERSTQRLKLIDFGLSKHLESVATLGVGTPDYMPPEMIKSQMKQQQQQQYSQQQHQQPQEGLPPYCAKAVDAWSMGVLLYLLVTGIYPFEDQSRPNNLAATILNVQAGRCRPLPAYISHGCRALISGLLCPDPAQRTRLEDLAFNPWLLQSAAAHAAKLGPHIGAMFDVGNPAWVLPCRVDSSQLMAGSRMGLGGGSSAGIAAAADRGMQPAALQAHSASAAAATPALATAGPVAYSFAQPHCQQHQQHQQQALSWAGSSDSGNVGPHTDWHSCSPVASPPPPPAMLLAPPAAAAGRWVPPGAGSQQQVYGSSSYQAHKAGPRSHASYDGEDDTAMVLDQPQPVALLSIGGGGERRTGRNWMQSLMRRC